MLTRYRLNSDIRTTDIRTVTLSIKRSFRKTLQETKHFSKQNMLTEYTKIVHNSIIYILYNYALMLIELIIRYLEYIISTGFEIKLGFQA